ncbi:hypothetical protein EC957_007120 [Mortierella hygrophila]|uniref:Uncharacterized protein n=1 Tax=Mortierella hygrophila TaxID=979708 RepID=A0A9P6EXG2_9FUNG|nr:hypothetical protein EC957_007120 [Mortierella hygrophila]
MHQYPAYPSEPPFPQPPMQYEQQYPFYAEPNSYQYYPSIIGGSNPDKPQHTKSKSELESEAGPCFDDGLMESVDLEEEEPEILQFLVERAREDEKYRDMLQGYVGVDVKKFVTPEALRNAKRILELVDV